MQIFLRAFQGNAINRAFGIALLIARHHAGLLIKQFMGRAQFHEFFEVDAFLIYQSIEIVLRTTAGVIIKGNDPSDWFAHEGKVG